MCAQAQPLAERVPEDAALVYVGWAGAETLQSEYQASNLKKVWEASTLADFVQNKLPGILQEQVGADDAKGAANVKSLINVAKIFWQHPTTLIFGNGGVDQRRRKRCRDWPLCARQARERMRPTVIERV